MERKLFTLRVSLPTSLGALVKFHGSLPSTASNEVERQSWVTALELAKAKAIRAIESDEEDEDNSANTIPSEELNTAVRDLAIK